MHKYLSAIGFSCIHNKKDFNKLIKICTTSASERSYTSNGDETMLTILSKEFAPGMGLSVCGEYDENNNLFVNGSKTTDTPKNIGAINHSETKFPPIMNNNLLTRFEKNSKIILFDEATSALDNNSQEYIKETIDNLVKDHTIIIVAHRLSTIIDSDLIYVIDEGKVVGCGNHKELIKSCDSYKALYNNSFTFKIIIKI